MKVEIPTAKVFLPLLEPARYKGAWGGRGSGKSHFFGDKLIDDSLYERGLLSVCVRESQKSLKDSAKRLIETKLQEHRLGEAQGFKIFHDRIQTPGDGVIIFQGMQDHTAESIKSLEGFKRAWVEEAQTLSATSIKLLRPTIRAPGSELWFSWNPRRQNDPVDKMLRQGNLPTGAIVVKANWSDNPWFPAELEQERLDYLKNEPDQYDNVWDGGYVSVADGAYYARHLAEAKQQGRVAKVAHDPLIQFKAFVDIGGTGAKSDAFTMWVAQFIGKEIRCLKYYEAVGQEIGEHVGWLRSNGFESAQIYLPHDGRTHDRVYKVSYESAFKQAGFKVTIIPNQGAGAAMKRVEAGRRLFPSIWFDEEGCAGGLDALGWYHERKDEVRNIGLGPEHDWASHGADSFGAMCVAHKEDKPRANPKRYKPRRVQ